MTNSLLTVRVLSVRFEAEDINAYELDRKTTIRSAKSGK